LMFAYGNAFNVLPFGSSSHNPLRSNAMVASSSCFLSAVWRFSIALEKTSVNEAGCSGHAGLVSVVCGATGRSLRGAGLAWTGGVEDRAALSRSVTTDAAFVVTDPGLEGTAAADAGGLEVVAEAEDAEGAVDAEVAVDVVDGEREVAPEGSADVVDSEGFGTGVTTGGALDEDAAEGLVAGGKDGAGAASGAVTGAPSTGLGGVLSTVGATGLADAAATCGVAGFTGVALLVGKAMIAAPAEFAGSPTIVGAVVAVAGPVTVVVVAAI
jgi:hypothetical protein